MPLQFHSVLGRGAMLGVAELGHAPDAIAQRDKIRLLCLNEMPDISVLIHAK
jgi:hypothetical protein